MEEYGLTQEQVAQRMGKSRPAITNMLRLLALPQDVLALVEEEQLSAGHARAILAAPSADLQRQAAKQVMEHQLSVRQTEALIKARQKGESPRKSPSAPTWPSIWARWRRACPAPWVGRSPSPTRGKRAAFSWSITTTRT